MPTPRRPLASRHASRPARRRRVSPADVPRRWPPRAPARADADCARPRPPARSPSRGRSAPPRRTRWPRPPRRRSPGAVLATGGERRSRPPPSPPTLALGIALPLVRAGSRRGRIAADRSSLGGGDDRRVRRRRARPPRPTATATATRDRDGHADRGARARPSRRSRSARAPTGSRSAAASVFVANQRGGTLTVIDPETNEAAGEPIHGRHAAGRRRRRQGRRVGRRRRLGHRRSASRPRASRPRPRSVDVGDRPEAISLGKQLVWVANFNDGTVNRVDRATPALVGAPDRRRPRARRDLRRPPLRVGDELRRRHRQPDRPVDRAGRRRRRSPSATTPRGVIETADAAWIANAGDGTVTRLDRKTGEPLGDTIKVGRDPRQLALRLRLRVGHQQRRQHRDPHRREDRPRRRRADPGRQRSRSASPPAPARSGSPTTNPTR